MRAPVWLGALLLWGALFSPLQAQNRGRSRQVGMQLSTGVARVGEKVRLSVVSNGSGSARILELPTVDGLRFGEPVGPRRSQSLTIINGRRRKLVESSWSIMISCESAGAFTIPGLKLLVSGKEFVTEPVVLRVVRDITGANLGFFELNCSSSKVVEGMPFTLELLFGWNEDVKANYANLSIPWWDKLYGAIEVEQEGAVEGGESVTVNAAYTVPIERIQSPGRVGRVVFRVRRTFVATRSGALDLPTSFLEFGKKSQSFFGNGAKNNYFVRANDLALEVVALPEEGRPIEFSGAVGSFKVRASVNARDLIVGDSIKLTVDWTGTGNMEFFDAPALDRLDEFNGFQFYGSTEEKSIGRRRVIYDLAPLSAGVSEIPGVPLWSYDPERLEYRKLESSPIPLRVRGLEKAIDLDSTSTEESFEADIHDIDVRPPGPPSGERSAQGRQNSDRLLMGASASLLPLWLLLRSLVRRTGDPSGKQEKRRRQAGRMLERALAGDPQAPESLRAFTSYLSARSGEGEAAWIGRDLPRYAKGSGLQDHMTDWQAAGDLLERLECSVYAGGAAVPPTELLAMAKRLVEAGL